MAHLIGAFAFLAGLINPAGPQTMRTIGECLRGTGFSSEVIGRHAVAALVGYDTPQDEMVRVLQGAELITYQKILTDTGERKLAFLAFEREVYVFVFRHSGDPTAYEKQPDGTLAHHGDCLLRLLSGYNR